MKTLTPDIESALKALLDYEPVDEDGVMVLVSRQAIHEVIDEISSLRAKLEKAIEALKAPCNCYYGTIRIPQTGIAEMHDRLCHQSKALANLRDQKETK